MKRFVIDEYSKNDNNVCIRYHIFIKDDVLFNICSKD